MSVIVMHAGLEIPAPQTHAKQFLIGLKDPAELMNLDMADSPRSSQHSDVEVCLLLLLLLLHAMTRQLRAHLH